MKNLWLLASILVIFSCQKHEDDPEPSDNNTQNIPCYSGVWAKINMNNSTIKNGVIRHSNLTYSNPEDVFVVDSDTSFKFTLNMDFPFTSTCPDQHVLAIRDRWVFGVKDTIHQRESFKYPIIINSGHNSISGVIPVQKHDTCFFWVIGVSTFKDFGASVIID